MATKYIDAERLRAEIEKRLKNVRDYMAGVGMRYKGPKYYKMQGKESAYDALLSILYTFKQEQPAETDEVKWHNDEDYDETDKDRFVLGSVGIGYNGYYIPYSDLLKLPKEENK